MTFLLDDAYDSRYDDICSLKLKGYMSLPAGLAKTILQGGAGRGRGTKTKVVSQYTGARS